MKIKTSELTGAALDWAVAVCQNIECDDENRPIWFGDGETRIDYTPTTNWAQGGPIIEREGLGVVPSADDASVWVASIFEPDWKFNRTGPTPLIAAMRCYVASKLGDEVEIPEGLQ